MYNDGGSEVYRKMDDLNRLMMERVTSEPNWSYKTFRKVLIMLAGLGAVGDAVAVPAQNRPETVDISGIAPYIASLEKKMYQTGHEWSQAMLVDVDSLNLVMGKIEEGSEGGVTVSYKNQPGREGRQNPSGSIHIHTPGETSVAASGTDYETFLSNPQRQIEMIGLGEGMVIMVLKTSATPNNLSAEKVKTRIKGLMEEVYVNGEGSIMERAITFNRMVCLEFGVMMYLGNIHKDKVLKRVAL